LAEEYTVVTQYSDNYKGSFYCQALETKRIQEATMMIPDPRRIVHHRSEKVRKGYSRFVCAVRCEMLLHSLLLV